MPDEKFDKLLSIHEAKKERSDEDADEQVRFEPAVSSTGINKYPDLDETLEDVVLGEVGDFEININDNDPDIIKNDELKLEIEKEPTPPVPQEEENQPEEQEQNHQHEDKPASGVKEIVAMPFTVKGTKTWNRLEPYIIAINQEALGVDYSALGSAFYIITEPVDEKAEQKELKTQLMKYLRAPNSKAQTEYVAFALKILSIELKKIQEYFDIKDNFNIFIYHLGILTVYQILATVLKNNGIGYCYQHITGNKIKKIFPDEFLKEKVAQWFEENINMLELEFDSVYKFNEIKAIVSRKYKTIIKVFNKRHYDLNLKIGPGKSVSMEELIKLKGESWFGTGNILVFKRFISKTIFN